MNTDFYPCNLCHLWLKLIWKPAEELNLVPSAQLLWFGLEDRCRERGPRLEAMVRLELTRFCLQDSRSTSWSYIASLNGGRGVRPMRLCELHGPGTVFVLPG